MSGAFKPLRTNDEFLSMISYFSGASYGSYFASVLVGCLLTVIIQSSSAMLGITIALASTGVIPFSTAAALVLGENVGTTITALLASVGTTTNAKRAARAHALFNVFGVVIIFSILPFYIDFIEALVPGAADQSLPDGSKPNIATHIAASHTFFNVCSTIIFLPFLGLLAKAVVKITPDKEEEKKQLKLIGDQFEILPATAIVQADLEVKKMKDILERMYLRSKDYLVDPQSKTLAKVQDYERITDNIQKEVTVFLCKVMENPLSGDQSKQSQAIIKIVDEFESIADYLERIVSYKERFKQDPQGGASNKEYFEFMENVWEFFQICTKGYIEGVEQNKDYIIKKSEQLRIWADDMRDRHIDRVSKGEYEALTALTYSDMVVALRKIRAHAMNVAEAYELYKSEKA